jgi:hypothetical protein
MRTRAARDVCGWGTFGGWRRIVPGGRKSHEPETQGSYRHPRSIHVSTFWPIAGALCSADSDQMRPVATRGRNARRARRVTPRVSRRWVGGFDMNSRTISAVRSRDTWVIAGAVLAAFASIVVVTTL